MSCRTGRNDYPGLIFGAPSGRLVKQSGDVGRRAQAAPAGASPAIDAGP